MLVSAIMPTRGRQKWAAQAVKCFMSQTYPNKELIILDDPTDPSFPDGLYLPRRILRFIAGGTGTIAQKRNSACQLSYGEIIMHFDSDDWSAPERMADQVKRLEESGKQVTGYHSMLFHVAQDGRWLKYCGDPSYALGTSLCYRRPFWADHPFRDGGSGYAPNVGEDSEFVKVARQAGELVTTDGDTLIYARIHEGNTSIKNISGEQIEYRPVPIEAIPQHLR